MLLFIFFARNDEDDEFFYEDDGCMSDTDVDDELNLPVGSTQNKGTRNRH